MKSYRVEENSEEKFSSSDALIQLPGASRILIVEDGVCEETTGLSGQHLKHRSVISRATFWTGRPISLDSRVIHPRPPTLIPL